MRDAVIIYIVCLEAISNQHLMAAQSPDNDTTSAPFDGADVLNATDSRNAVNEALGQLIKSLALMKPYSEFHLLHDSRISSQSQADIAAQTLSLSDIPSSSFETRHLAQFQKSLPLEPCPTYDAQKGDIRRNARAFRLLPARFHKRAIFTWITTPQSLEEAYSLFNNTVEMCPQQVDPGLFNDHTNFFFYVGTNQDLLERTFKPEYSRLRSHPRVAVIKLLKSERGNLRIGIYRYNFFNSANQSPTLTYVYSDVSKTLSERDIFTHLDNFEGTQISVTAMPWSAFLNGDRVDRDPTHVWTNYWGYEISMLQTISEALNFTYSIHNPLDQNWSPTRPDGSFGGMIGELARGEADVAMGDFGFYHSRSQVARISTSFDTEFFTLATPGQRPLARTSAIFLPFSSILWTCVVVAVPLMAMVLFVVASVEGFVQNTTFHPFDEPVDVLWMAYSQIVNQYHSDTMTFVIPDAIRCVLFLWSFVCFLLTASYGGMLRSFLTRPMFEPAVDSLEALAASHLPVHMAIYGTTQEQIMATSKDPVVKHIWRNKIVDNRDSAKVLQDVYLGTAAYLGWWSDLSTELKLSYTASDGTPLIHVSTTPIILSAGISGWYFTPFLPWKEAIDAQLYRILSSGLISKWTSQAQRRLKMATLSSSPAISPTVTSSSSESEPMKVGDYTSAFLFLGSVLAVANLSFVAEHVFQHIQKRRNMIDFSFHTATSTRVFRPTSLQQ